MELLNFALDKMVNTLGMAGGAIHVFHRARESLVLGSYIGLSARLARRLETIEYGDTAIGRTAKNKRLLIIRNLRLSHDYEFFGGKLEGFSYMAAVPIISEGENWGVIAIFGKGVHKPGSLQVDLLEQFGEQLGAALVLGRQVRNTQASRDNFSTLVKSIGDELCSISTGPRGGANVARSIGWLVTRMVGGDRFDLCSRTPRGWLVTLSSEPGVENQLLHVNGDSGFAEFNSTGITDLEKPAPFNEFISGKSYAYCHLDESELWAFVRLEGRRRHSTDFELLRDSFRIVMGLYKRIRASAPSKPEASVPQPAAKTVLATDPASVLERISGDLGKLIAEYSKASSDSDLKELLTWLNFVQKSAIEASRPAASETSGAGDEAFMAESIYDIIDAAMTKLPDEKRSRLVFRRDSQIMTPPSHADSLVDSVLEFLSAALYESESRGTLKLTIRENDRSVLLELEGDQLAPGPKIGERPAWLQVINGRIECSRVESDEGRIVDTWRLIIPAESGQGSQSSESQKPFRVLAVDAQEVIRELLTGMLESLGHESLVVADSDEAIKSFTDGLAVGHPFRMVIADYGLDKMTGLELARKLKSIDNSIFFLLVSSWGLEPEEARAREMGIDAMLKKPFRMEQLAEIIETAQKEAVR
jgi:CheY-like chemotaxis protein